MRRAQRRPPSRRASGLPCAAHGALRSPPRRPRPLRGVRAGPRPQATARIPSPSHASLQRAAGSSGCPSAQTRRAAPGCASAAGRPVTRWECLRRSRSRDGPKSPRPRPGLRVNHRAQMTAGARRPTRWSCSEDCRPRGWQSARPRPWQRATRWRPRRSASSALVRSETRIQTYRAHIGRREARRAQAPPGPDREMQLRLVSS
mmetsp:Transcript_1887/g.5010  ORF Transcript_1887/g.5010 Transcript_1887/m.5010 type:complete len:203 (+) Transcript_1887:168-776(+)|eukprot:scaffold39939_cov30-Tisochrysis_lutea.AAC.2